MGTPWTWRCWPHLMSLTLMEPCLYTKRICAKKFSCVFFSLSFWGDCFRYLMLTKFLGWTRLLRCFGGAVCGCRQVCDLHSQCPNGSRLKSCGMFPETVTHGASVIKHKTGCLTWKTHCFFMKHHSKIIAPSK